MGEILGGIMFFAVIAVAVALTVAYFSSGVVIWGGPIGMIGAVLSVFIDCLLITIAVFVLGSSVFFAILGFIKDHIFVFIIILLVLGAIALAIFFVMYRIMKAVLNKMRMTAGRIRDAIDDATESEDHHTVKSTKEQQNHQKIHK